MLSSVRRAVDGAFTGFWGGGCWTTGRLRKPAPRWESPGGQRVLVVAPHPDDEVAGCGGVILLHRRAGDRVTVVHVTDGQASRAGGLAAAAMAERRRHEAEESARVLQLDDWQWLGLPERQWKDVHLAVPLARVLATLAPHVVYAPSRVDFHPEHYAVARVIAEVSALSVVHAMRIYQVQVPLTHVLVNLTAPIAPVRDTALAASAVYLSQETSLRGAWRLKTYAARAQGLPGGAEEFWELTPAAYAALHAERPPRPLVDTFRGLRRLALTDPLAFAQGRAERRRLRHLAADR
jgi:LmbE family N-acetylglucosaminyl deacetylase